MQMPHQVAQNWTSTTLPRRFANLKGLPSSVLPSNSISWPGSSMRLSTPVIRRYALLSWPIGMAPKLFRRLLKVRRVRLSSPRCSTSIAASSANAEA